MKMTSSSPTKHDLQAVIERAHGWSEGEKGSYIGWVFSDEGYQLQLEFTPEDFDRVDKRYRPVLQTLLNSTHRSHLYMRDTIKMWVEPMPLLEQAGFSNRYIANMVQVRASTVNEVMQTLVVQCDVYHAGETAEGISYCSSHDTDEVVLPLDWIEKHYPGSIERMRIGISLDLDGRDLRNYMIEPTQQVEQHVSVPDDIFDNTKSIL